MDSFHHLLNWKLKAGSHRFPGSNGGTCINEAALVAAGFEYRPIHYPEQMSECFSRPICSLAMELNDDASDADRQRLLPFVTRLACADTPAIEQQREEYVLRHTRDCVRLPFGVGLETLEGALAIGRQADPLGPEEVQIQMDAVRSGQSKPRRAADPVPAAGKPFIPEVKSWLTSEEAEPAV